MIEFLNVLAAALAAYVFGSLWYMSLAKPWMAAAGTTEAEVKASGPVAYVVSALAVIVVAAMMRHVFVLAEIDSVGKGLISALGIGLFLVVPWLATNYTFASRPNSLILIDGGYAAIGCTLIGVVLTLF